MNITNIQEQVLAKLPPMDEKNRYYYLGGMLLLVFLLDYFLIMQPQLRTLMTLNPKISLLQRDYGKAQDDINKFKEYQVTLEKLRSQKNVLGNTVLLKEEISTILENISLLANSSGIKINQIVPLKDSEKVIMENEDGQYYSFPVLVDARGGYHNLGQFFNRLETDAIFMNISSFDMAANSADLVNHSARITVNAFYLDKGTGENKSKPGKDNNTGKKAAKR